MYIDPFVAGVLATISAEFVLVIIVTGIGLACDKKNGKK